MTRARSRTAGSDQVAVIELLTPRGLLLYREVLTGESAFEQRYARAQELANKYQTTAVILWRLGGLWTVSGNFSPTRSRAAAPAGDAT